MKKYTFFRSFIRVLPMVFRAAPIVYSLAMLSAIVAGVGSGAIFTLMQRFFDSVALYIGGQADLRPVIAAALLLAALTIGLQLLTIVRNFLGGQNYMKIMGAFFRHLHQKSTKLHPGVFEDAATLDMISRARRGARCCMNLVFLVVDTLTSFAPFFIYMGFYLFSLNPVLLLAILLTFLPCLMSLAVNIRIQNKLEWYAAPLHRQLEHFENCVGDRAYFKETRMLGAFPYFIGMFRETLELLIKKERSAYNKARIVELGPRIFTVLGYAGILYILFSTLMSGKISVGAFAAVFASIDGMFSRMESAVTEQGLSMSYNIAPAINFLRFLDLPEHKGADGALNAAEGIVFDNVTYTYPGSAKPAVSGLSFRIEPHDTIAIVGENGAGKTTLVKLLMGLLLPTSGEVTIGGRSTAKTSPGSLFGGQSAVFQKYQRYWMTLSQNIRISEMKKEDSPDEAATCADLHTDSLPEGMDTVLSKEFGGTDLSGGQWQRVAIARGLYRSHDFIILDEPTASIDPIEETKVYEEFAKICKGKTAVIVTHRLGSARIANRIFVLDGGHIDDVGTHEELVAKGGLYARMFKAQAQWYA
jgi:ATP-binding cassette subfamily B protein